MKLYDIGYPTDSRKYESTLFAQQIQDLKEQLNTLKAEAGNGANVAVTLQLVRQLASAPYHLRDPFAILAALQKLADEARVTGDPSASRYEAILRQSRPLSNSPDFGNIIIRLIGSKEESEVANSIAKMSRQRGSGSFLSLCQVEFAATSSSTCTRCPAAWSS
ncbi:hypothetical protein ACROYT_G039746 [Oculina patagonica]